MVSKFWTTFSRAWSVTLTVTTTTWAWSLNFVKSTPASYPGSSSPRVSRKVRIGASGAGNGYSRLNRVHGRNPDPTSASSAPVRYLMIEVLPLWVRPNSQKTGDGARRRASARRAWSCRSSPRNRFASRAQAWSMSSSGGCTVVLANRTPGCRNLARLLDRTFWTRGLSGGARRATRGRRRRIPEGPAAASSRGALGSAAPAHPFEVDALLSFLWKERREPLVELRLRNEQVVLEVAVLGKDEPRTLRVQDEPCQSLDAQVWGVRRLRDRGPEGSDCLL